MKNAIATVNLGLALMAALLTGALSAVVCHRAWASTPGDCPSVIVGTCPPNTVLIQESRYGFECAQSGTQGCCLYDAYNAGCYNGSGVRVSHTIVAFLNQIYPNATCAPTGVCRANNPR